MKQNISVKSSELDEAMSKVEKLNMLLEEANSLIKELASQEVKVFASIKNLENSD